MPLKGIPAAISPELLYALASMGHGDEIVLADSNFPSESVSRANGARLISADGLPVPKLLKQILKLFPLDQYVNAPVALMDLVDDDKKKGLQVPIWNEYKQIVGNDVQFEMVERFAFYERAKKCFAVVRTGESAIYANIILKKGVVVAAKKTEENDFFVFQRTMTKIVPTHRDLFHNLKSIVFCLHRYPGDGLRRQYGALQRLRSAILTILIDGLKRNSTDVHTRLWQLIIALNKRSHKYLQLLQDVYQQGNNQTSVEQWIEQSILHQCFTEQIEKEILVFEDFYTNDAFLRRSTYYQAFSLCIQSIEYDQVHRLYDIDPNLSLVENVDRTSDQHHPLGNINKNRSKIVHRRIHSEPVISSNELTKFFSNSNSSLNLQTQNQSIEQIATLTIDEEESIDRDDKKQYLPNSSLSWPRKDQTLEDYLHEHDSQTRTDMEKENAHFYLSEIVLTGIEYVKFRQTPSSIKLLPIESNCQESNLTAESIALAVLERWKTLTFPSARDLFETLTSDSDGSLVKREFDENLSRQSSVRGNNEWAPPREQLIFHIQHPISREKQLEKQTYRCAGCGKTVEKGFSDRFRYCEYTGKYFCYNCHSDLKYYLPAYIIHRWDFSNKHSVSNFAYNYLTRLFTSANFDIYHLNSKLFEKSSTLKFVNELRWSLHYLQSYILTCRLAKENGTENDLQTIPSYIYEYPHNYTLDDLIETKLGHFRKCLEPLANRLREHVIQCPICRGKGFFCEICQNNDDLLFSFNVKTTSICSECQSCFHRRCYENENFACRKCQRNQKRKSLGNIQSILSNEDIPLT